MRIALTGTPGVGKSTLAGLLRESGQSVIDLAAWAADNDAWAGTDADGTGIIDLDELSIDDFSAACFIDSHMAHHLAVDAVWLVRCDPVVLRERLQARGYSTAKVTENLEAEAMDLILQETLHRHKRVVQRDGTHRTPESLLMAFKEADTEALKEPDLESVDWSDRLLDGI